MIYLVFSNNVSKIFLRHLEESKCLIHILCKEYHLKGKAYDWKSFPKDQCYKTYW